MADDAYVHTTGAHRSSTAIRQRLHSGRGGAPIRDSGTPPPLLSLPHVASPVAAASTSQTQQQQTNGPSGNGDGGGGAEDNQRRRSSMLSDFSVDDVRQSLRASADNFKTELAAGGDDGGGAWHWLPLAFVFLPIAAGLLFHNGSPFLTDLMLVIGAFWVMSGSVKEPWEWYKIAQEDTLILMTEAPSLMQSDIIIEEEEEEDGEGKTDDASKEETSRPASPTFLEAQSRNVRDNARYQEAVIASRRREVYYLILCFVIPFAVSCLLYWIRIQLARPHDGLVSAIDLRIWLLVAEVRPTTLLLRRLGARQTPSSAGYPRSTSNADTNTMVNKAVEQAIKRRSNSPARAEFDELKKRFEDLETHVMDNSSSIAQAVEGDKESTARTVETAVQQSIQPQLDALNRAVRRYEKRAVTQAIQTEARMQQLELRIRDALALAELAARRSNSNGQLGSSPLVGLVGRVVTAPFSVMLALARWPFDTMRSVVQKAAAVVVGNEKKDRGRRRGKMDYPGGMRVTKMPRR